MIRRLIQGQFCFGVQGRGSGTDGRNRPSFLLFLFRWRNSFFVGFVRLQFQQQIRIVRWLRTCFRLLLRLRWLLDHRWIFLLCWLSSSDRDGILVITIGASSISRRNRNNSSANRHGISSSSRNAITTSSRSGSSRGSSQRRRRKRIKLWNGSRGRCCCLFLGRHRLLERGRRRRNGGRSRGCRCWE